jgi:hypothetical protein
MKPFQNSDQLTMNSISRRFLFQRTGLGLGAMSLSGLLGNQRALAAAETHPMLPRQPMFAPRAKRIIYLHMIGAPSIIQKPWTTTDFLSRIRAVLDAPPNVPLDASATHDPSRAG